MLNKLTKMLESAGVRALALGIVGVWLLLAPWSVYTVIKWVLVAALLANAVPPLTAGLRSRRTTGSGGWQLSWGIFLAVSALLAAAFLRPMLSMLPALLGIMAIFFGINKITSAKGDRQYVNVSPVPQMIYGGLVIVVGVLLVFNPFHATMLLFRIVGGVMIAMAVMEIGTALRRH